ncbi:hypothetical protein [Oligoflexus tunisiensis]|uniref:hypothetical protein n=1 Tax=Oligoflexus tunisiensis TaxID=708132 RepID=UPI00114D299E|nr:hypothetical protein [Oligoflexus tunisiensis]
MSDHLQPNDSDKAESHESRRARQKRDQEYVKVAGKGSGLDDLADEQRELSNRKKMNKLNSDEVKHH